jgi:hypothetical protein
MLALPARLKSPTPAIWKLPGCVPRSKLPAHWPLLISHSSVSPLDVARADAGKIAVAKSGRVAYDGGSSVIA